MEILIHIVIGVVILIAFLVWRNNRKAAKRRKFLLEVNDRKIYGEK